MAWTTPKTWNADEVLTASDMNTYVRDNTEALRNRESDDYVLDGGTDYTYALATWADIDSTNLSLQVTISGEETHLEVHFHGVFSVSAINSDVQLDFTVNGVRQGGQAGIIGMRFTSTGQRMPITFTRLIGPLSPGTYTINMQWKTNATATMTLYNGAAGTVNTDFESQFWIHEK